MRLETIMRVSRDIRNSVIKRIDDIDANHFEIMDEGFRKVDGALVDLAIKALGEIQYYTVDHFNRRSLIEMERGDRTLIASSYPDHDKKGSVLMKFKFRHYASDWTSYSELAEWNILWRDFAVSVDFKLSLL